MAADGALSYSVASLVEDVLQQHGSRPRGLDLDARRAEEAAMRRYEAAQWLRKMVGVVGGKDLPAEPSEEEFRVALRNGIILCSALNKIQPSSVVKVVETPCDAMLIPDGAALSAYQYFENLRNFLVAVNDLGIPSFEASDMEQGGACSRIVNCVLGLKSFAEWKQTGATPVWKFGGNAKPTASARQIMRKKSEPFMNSLSRAVSMNDRSLTASEAETESNTMPTLSNLVRRILSDKRPEEVPNLVESILKKVVDEFEQRVASQSEAQSRATSNDSIGSLANKGTSINNSRNTKVEQANTAVVKKEDAISDLELKTRCTSHQTIVDQQQRDLKDLKQTLCTTKAGVQFMQKKFYEELQNIGQHIHGLAHAASGYHRVLEENRKLYNQVQDLKGSIRVYCRVRPFLHGQPSHSSIIDDIEEGTITIHAPTKYGKGSRSFNFNKVFGPSVTQGEVFADMQPLIRSVLDGFNVCIFAYGQTGSGKTYTMSGPKDLGKQNEGVNYRALGDLFLLAEQRKDTFHYDVSVQMIEIYNEQVRDLLGSDGLNKRLEIRSCSQGLAVPHASVIRVSTTSDVIDLMDLGQRNRAVGATALNDRSSRSHSCLTVHVQGKDLTSGTILHGCMHLVDLAGSERVNKSEVTGDRLKEAQHINKSLSALGDVISALAQKNTHVPYRNSKLTQLLQDSLGGQAKTLMFVHISPEPEALGETISTLKFAERVATVELGAARVNKDSADVKELKEQIASLKAALAKKEMEPVHQKMPHSPCNMLVGSNNRKPMEEVGNIEVNNSSPWQKRQQSLDLEEDIYGNSPLWPPVNSPGGAYFLDDRDISTGEWVDKVMVNKQEPTPGVKNPFGDWEAENGEVHSILHQKYVSENSHNLFPSANQFDSTATDDLEELGPATSDSSDPDFLWQLNRHPKLSSVATGVGSKIPKPSTKTAKSPNSGASVHKTGSRKKNGIAQYSQLSGRLATPVEMKRKSGSRK
ncbi:unnamed protein product [Cuscuta campestris]|uniref:Kinesin motor domain-containing protein n=1 Tax=Cuscuta campestris TaxID=132261 RepID=A0A484KRP0_9ASTE|nr:unnamed protein product [Cuscuta campestris]